MDKNQPLYVISIAAELVGMHPQTLRLYERIGLIKPRRSERKTRLYSDEDIERLRKIQHLTQDLGVNLAGAEVILGMIGKLDTMRQEMEQEMEQMREEMEEEVRRIKQRFEGESVEEI
ncbi:MAG: hypothetical protein COS84_01140 [Armatimonadetes bacterium CG07_land_8_20_14_0_80_40_9]|nr:MAG: hypothetical protein COS84_01140 [Armatimonadetes bacterium CG07_land_8_20_14_0_80_40_9]